MKMQCLLLAFFPVALLLSCCSRKDQTPSPSPPQSHSPIAGIWVKSIDRGPTTHLFIHENGSLFMARFSSARFDTMVKAYYALRGDAIRLFAMKTFCDTIKSFRYRIKSDTLVLSYPDTNSAVSINVFLCLKRIGGPWCRLPKDQLKLGTPPQTEHNPLRRARLPTL